MNINKYISNAGYCSRREADRIIKAGRVKINQKIATVLDKVSDTDRVFIDSKAIKPTSNQKIYLAFNKPFGVISTTDDKSPNNIMGYIKLKERVYPIGRLDVKSTGLILLTNDGDIVNQILKSKTVEKEYVVKVDRVLTDNFLAKISKGVVMDGRLTLPAKIKKISSKIFQITIVEGRKRQIRRICERFRYNVLELKRIRIGKIEIGNIPEGKYIEIASDKIYDLLELKNS